MSRSKISEAASLMGRKGGPRAAKALNESRTPAERSAAARKAAMARWAKRRQESKK